MTNYLTISTFNILHEGYAEKNKENLPSGVAVSIAIRIPHIVTVLQEAKPDIYCLQECAQATSAAIANTLGFKAVHTPRLSEGLAIHFNPARFTLIHSQAITTHPGNQKKALIVTLKETATQKMIRIITAHLTGGADRTKGKEELTQIKNYVSQDLTLDTIIAGDFNRECNEMGELMESEETKFPNPFHAALDHPEIHTEQASITNRFRSRRIDHFITNLTIEKEIASQSSSAAKLASDHLALSGIFIPL